MKTLKTEISDEKLEQNLRRIVANLMLQTTTLAAMTTVKDEGRLDVAANNELLQRDISRMQKVGKEAILQAVSDKYDMFMNLKGTKQ